MPIFQVNWVIYGNVQVEADTEDEASDKALNMTVDELFDASGVPTMEVEQAWVDAP